MMTTERRRTQRSFEIIIGSVLLQKDGEDLWPHFSNAFELANAGAVQGDAFRRDGESTDAPRSSDAHYPCSGGKIARTAN